MAAQGIDMKDCSLVKAIMEGCGKDYSIDVWDEGYGPVWVYRETMGIVGFVRAENWERAWEACVDEIMHDAAPFAEWDPEEREAAEADGTLPEGMHHRGGVPSNHHRKEAIAQEDLNGSALELLTVEQMKEWRIRLYWSGEEFEFPIVERK